MSQLVEPLYQAIEYSLALKFILSLEDYDNIVLLHSAGSRSHSGLGRYSFVALDPFAMIVDSNSEPHLNAFAQIAKLLNHYSLETINGLPPFQGGLAGYLSYDIARDIEILPEQASADIYYPTVTLGCYDLVLAIDHQQQIAWIIASGLPEIDEVKRILRARQRLHWLTDEIHRVVNYPALQSIDDVVIEHLQSNFTRQQYMDTVGKIIHHIREGDIFQANISQRFHCELPQKLTTWQLYLRLSHYNPAPFASYVKFGQLAIVSSSPERFINVNQQNIQTRPIKGTIARSDDPVTDKAQAAALTASIKDRAENAMIVDLMRNDLSKVCLPHSVNVSQFCGLESYENVHHLVSVINGKLRPDAQLVDVLQATLPGGSITGAPKVRAMEIIDALEPTRRGPYCGNTIYMGFDGNMDSSILIRSFVIKNRMLSFQVGGAVVLNSDPETEYLETLTKADKLIYALKTPLASTPRNITV